MRYQQHFRDIVLFLTTMANFAFCSQVLDGTSDDPIKHTKDIKVDGIYTIRSIFFNSKETQDQYQVLNRDGKPALNLGDRSKQANKQLFVQLINTFFFYRLKIGLYVTSAASITRNNLIERLAEEYALFEEGTGLKILLNKSLNPDQKIRALFTSDANQTLRDEIMKLYGDTQEVRVAIDDPNSKTTIEYRVSVKGDQIDAGLQNLALPIKAKTDNVIEWENYKVKSKSLMRSPFDKIFVAMAAYWTLAENESIARKKMKAALIQLYSKKASDQKMSETEMELYLDTFFNPAAPEAAKSG